MEWWVNITHPYPSILFIMINLKLNNLSGTSFTLASHHCLYFSKYIPLVTIKCWSGYLIYLPNDEMTYNLTKLNLSWISVIGYRLDYLKFGIFIMAHASYFNPPRQWWDVSRVLTIMRCNYEKYGMLQSFIQTNNNRSEIYFNRYPERTNPQWSLNSPSFLVLVFVQ